LSCIELRDTSTLCLGIKKWYELFREKIADRETPHTNSSCIERKKLAIEEFVEPYKG